MSVNGYIESIRGIGLPTTTVGTIPGAGTEDLDLTVPSDEIWIPLSCQAEFAAGVGGARRRMLVLYVDDAANEFCNTISDYAITAGDSALFNFGRGEQRFTSLLDAAQRRVQSPLIQTVLIPGYVWRFRANGAQAPDLYSNVFFHYLKYITQ